MWEQPRFLEDIAGTPAFGWNIDTAGRGRIEQRVAIDRDPTAIGTQQPCDHVQYARLADPRRTEQHRGTFARVKRQRDLCVAEPLLDIDLKGHGAPVRRAA